MIYWKIARQMKRKHLENASQLAAFVGVSKPLAKRLMSTDPISRIDLRTLGKVCGAFDCEPGDVLKIELTKKRAPRAK